jgi:hypothetical protein
MAMSAVVLLRATVSAGPAEYGHFKGDLEVKWLVGPSNDPQWNRVQLLKELAFIDADSTLWDAPEGTVSDGATIPRPLWSVVGSPYTGPYLPAAVIHDVGCQKKTRTWEATHWAFYHAMRAAAVPVGQARIMFAGVYL